MRFFRRGGDRDTPEAPADALQPATDLETDLRPVKLATVERELVEPAPIEAAPAAQQWAWGATYSPEKALAEIVYTKYGWYKEYVSGTMAPDAELLFGPAPWLADHPKGKFFAFSAFLRPNFYLFARADMVQPFVAYPVGVNKTRVTGWTCIPKQFVDSPAFADKVAILARFVRKFAGEDNDLVRAMQKGLGSRYFRRGPMHELEAIVYHRINRYLDAVHGTGEVL